MGGKTNNAKCPICTEIGPVAAMAAGHTFNHGERGYTKHNCRCEICQAAYDRRRHWPSYGKCVLCTGIGPVAAMAQGHTFKHGRQGYIWHHCRCEVCTDASRQYMSDYQNRDDYGCKRCQRGDTDHVQHGTWGAWEYCKCPCDFCRETYRQKRQEYSDAEDPEYIALQRRERTDFYNEAFPPIPYVHNQPWTPEEDAIVMDPNKTLSMMCLETSRTYNAVRGRRWLLKKAAAGECG